MYKYKAQVINIVDGDTIDCDVDMGFYITTRQRFRIKGIDAPEVRGPEKAEGKKAKKWLQDVLLNASIVLTTYKADSFGRWLCDVNKGDLDIASHMVELGIARLYEK